MRLESDANAAKFNAYELVQAGRRFRASGLKDTSKKTATVVAAATPPGAAGERFMLPRDLLGQTATRSAACEPLRTSGWER